LLDSQKDRREMLMARFFNRQVLASNDDDDDDDDCRFVKCITQDASTALLLE